MNFSVQPQHLEWIMEWGFQKFTVWASMGVLFSLEVLTYRIRARSEPDRTSPGERS